MNHDNFVLVAAILLVGRSFTDEDIDIAIRQTAKLNNRVVDLQESGQLKYKDSK